LVNKNFQKELIKVLSRYVELKKASSEGKYVRERTEELINIINKTAETYNKDWLYLMAADIFYDIYGGFNEVSAKYMYLGMNYILRVLEGLIIAWFEDKKGFFKENVNPILLADAIERLMYAIKGLENYETYNILGGLFKKIVEHLDRRAYRNVWKNLWERAKKYYLRSLSINMNNYEAYEGLGDLYLLVEEYKEALNQYTNAVLLKRDEKRLWSKLALVFEELGEIDKAIESLEESLKYGVDEETIRKLVKLYERKGLKEKVERLNKLLMKK